MIVILCAPSGSGKSTMVKHLLETYPGEYELSILNNDHKLIHELLHYTK